MALSPLKVKEEIDKFNKLVDAYFNKQVIEFEEKIDRILSERGKFNNTKMVVGYLKDMNDNHAIALIKRYKLAGWKNVSIKEINGDKVLEFEAGIIINENEVI
jgi:hypothetical protein